MKLKDYEIPQYGLEGGGLEQEDLSQYSLKNFDLAAFQLSQMQAAPAPMPAPSDPYPLYQQTNSAVAPAPEAPPANALLQPNAWSAPPEAASPSPVLQPNAWSAPPAPPSPSPLLQPNAWGAPPDAPSPNPLLQPNAWGAPPESPNEPSFTPAANPVQTELLPPALDPSEVQFGLHFSLQTVSFTPLSPAQGWKLPRWVVVAVGLFFGSAAVMTLVACVVLLRDPKGAPTEPVAAPTATVATASAALAPSPSSSTAIRTAGDVAHAASAPARETTTKTPVAAVRHAGPVTASLMRDDAALPHRTVVSRHPSVVRRQSYGSRHVASKSSSSSLAPEETETASRRPAPDALDKLLGESTL